MTEIIVDAGTLLALLAVAAVFAAMVWAGTHVH
jgi:hypothetical protein